MPDLADLAATDALLDALGSRQTSFSDDPAVDPLLALAALAQDPPLPPMVEIPAAFDLRSVTDRRFALRSLAAGVAAVGVLSTGGVSAAMTGDPLRPVETVLNQFSGHQEKMPPKHDLPYGVVEVPAQESVDVLADPNSSAQSTVDAIAELIRQAAWMPSIERATVPRVWMPDSRWDAEARPSDSAAQSQPEATTPRPAEPAAPPPGSTEPGSSAPPSTEPGTSTPPTTEPGTSTPPTTTPTTPPSDGTDPDGTDPDGTDPDGTDPDGTDPDGTDPDGTDPDAEPEDAETTTSDSADGSDSSTDTQIPTSSSSTDLDAAPADSTDGETSSATTDESAGEPTGEPTSEPV
ncbi:MAG: hypothetical protein GEU96_03275 [Propionibacteriales bacterium]|nr:hypothetical protein [Propionibacteriales bacterium]